MIVPWAIGSNPTASAASVGLNYTFLINKRRWL
jgi:hypothetical protein